MDMETAKTQRVGTREGSGRWPAWLICAALVTVASGCGACQQVIRPAEPTGPGMTCPGGPLCGIVQALMDPIPDNCPTGNCDPGGSGNAKGIYTVEGGNYCFEAMGEQYFCPEAFINTAAGVVLDVRYLNNAKSVIKTQVHGRLAANPNKPVDVLAIHSDRSELSIKYRVQGDSTEHIAKGADLSKVILTLRSLAMGGGDASPLVSYEMKFSGYKAPEPDAKTDRVHRYKLEYRDVSFGQGWRQHCAKDGAGTVVAFLPGERVSGMNGSVKLDANVTTMGCEKGSVVTCMAWGYTPWEPSTGVRDEVRDYVYRSCLQAKRAAYFVGKGDFRSYTETGTKIEKWDQYHSGEGTPVERIEALWSPHGVVCFNKENRRKPQAEAWKGQDPNNLKTYGVGPCTSKDFTLEGKLFTGLPPTSGAQP
ncbi:hypothetical protein F0U59_09530 [Archangium gephyra]|nr:hypothetical protein F0U59_09530 [Archangium gephyra]